MEPSVPGAPEPTPAQLEIVRETLRDLRTVLPLNSRDFASDRLDAMLYALFVGWECEEHPAGQDHDEDCGGLAPTSLDRVGDKFGWSEELRAQARQRRQAIAALANGPAAPQRRAPVQRSGAHPAGSIAWPEHEAAYRAYASRYGTGQSAEQIATRHGFSYAELVDLLGHAPTTWTAGHHPAP